MFLRGWPEIGRQTFGSQRNRAAKWQQFDNYYDYGACLYSKALTLSQSYLPLPLDSNTAKIISIYSYVSQTLRNKETIQFCKWESLKSSVHYQLIVLILHRIKQESLYTYFYYKFNSDGTFSLISIHFSALAFVYVLISYIYKWTIYKNNR